MRLMGLLLAISGWAICLVALLLMPGVTQRTIFIVTGLAVEGLGFGVLAFGYKAAQINRRKTRGGR